MMRRTAVVETVEAAVAVAITRGAPRRVCVRGRGVAAYGLIEGEEMAEGKEEEEANGKSHCLIFASVLSR